MASLLDKRDEARARGNPPPDDGGADEVMVGVGLEVDETTGLLIQNPVGEPQAGDPLEADYILVRRIGILDGAGGPFGFVDPGQAVVNSPGLLGAIVTALQDETFAPVLPPKPPFPGDGPLDVHCDETTTIVFALVDPGDGRKFRFSRSSRGISLGGIPDDDRQNYFGLRHVAVATAGLGTALHHNAEDCRIVYFTARRTEDPFKHSFNLHVEIVYPNGYEMPIIIDPDVRYPGGSG